MRLVFPLIAVTIALFGCASRLQSTRVDNVEVQTIRRHFANTHVVTTPEGTFLVDPGSDEGAAEMDAAMRELGFDPSSIDAIVITHAHADHAGAALHFRERYATPIVGGQGDLELFEEGRNDTLCPTDRRARRMVDDHQGSTYAPYRPDRYIEGETTLESLGLGGARTFSLPGHTEGSIVVQVGGAVFIGDILRGSIAGKKARTHFFICDLEDNRRDVAALLRAVPDGEVFFVGHFGPIPRAAVEDWLAGEGEETALRTAAR